MENILNAKWHHKINFLFYIKYRYKDDFDDEERFDVIMSSHDHFYMLSHRQNDDGFKSALIMLPESNVSGAVLNNYLRNSYQFINYYIITPESLYFEENRQFYHKMHFDIVSEDGTKGLMFFVREMLSTSLNEICDILDRDITEKQFGDIIDEYTQSNLEDEGR